MNDKIHIRTGALSEGRTEMPALSYDKDKGSELGYRTDEEALYIGTGAGNKRLCGAKDVGNINARIDAINETVTSVLAQIRDITSQISSINAQITDITARLGVLETPSE